MKKHIAAALAALTIGVGGNVYAGFVDGTRIPDKYHVAITGKASTDTTTKQETYRASASAYLDTFNNRLPLTVGFSLPYTKGVLGDYDINGGLVYKADAFGTISASPMAKALIRKREQRTDIVSELYLNWKSPEFSITFGNDPETEATFPVYAIVAPRISRNTKTGASTWGNTAGFRIVGNRTNVTIGADVYQNVMHGQLPETFVAPALRIDLKDQLGTWIFSNIQADFDANSKKRILSGLVGVLF